MCPGNGASDLNREVVVTHVQLQQSPLSRLIPEVAGARQELCLMRSGCGPAVIKPRRGRVPKGRAYSLINADHLRLAQ